jgi:hypothetical protein
MSEALQAVRTVSDTEAIITVDPSADQSIVRCLQELDRMHRYAQFDAADTTVMTFDDGPRHREDEPASNIFHARRIYLMYNSANVDRYRPVLATPPIYVGRTLAITPVDPDRADALRGFLGELYVERGN